MEVQKVSNTESIKPDLIASGDIQQNIKSDQQSEQREKAEKTSTPNTQLITATENHSALSTKYTQSYLDYGRLLLDQKIQDQFLHCIVNALPENYYGVDIGSCDGRFGMQIMNLKKGKILSVDPYPLSPDIVKLTGQDFLKLNQEIYDCIILKYSIHFFEDFEQFYHDLSRSLKPTGMAFILTLLPQSKIPWSDEIQKGFVNSFKNDSLKDTQNMYKNHDVKQTNFQILIKLKTQQFKRFLQKKGFSNLCQNTEEQIQRSNQNMPNSEEVEIVMRQRILQISNKKSQN